MTSLVPAIAYIVSGIVLASGASMFALQARQRGAVRMGAYALACLLWIALAFAIDEGLSRASRPWHAVAALAALFVVLGFPCYVIRQVLTRRD